MNIIEAIKSGKRIRRTAWIPSTSPEYWTTSLSQAFTFTKEDLLADDWELEEASAQITSSGYFRAYEEALREVCITDTDYRQLNHVVNVMAEKLGLGDQL